MSISKYHVSNQLFDKDNATIYNAYLTSVRWITSADSRSVKIPCQPNTQYTLSVSETLQIFIIAESANADIVPTASISPITVTYSNISEYTFTTAADTACIIFQGSAGLVNTWLASLMFNEGSTALPYEPYGDSFKDWFYREYGTETETFTSFPQTIIGDGQNISAYTIKGNMTQASQPSPSNPVYPTECGDKTANLFDYKTAYATYLQSDGTVVGTVQQLSGIQNSLANFVGQTITISIYCQNVSASRIQIIARENGTAVYSNNIIKNQSGYMIVTLTPQLSTDYWAITYGSAGSNETLSQFMLVEGSTAPSSYIPYGYKIPILSNGVSYPIYLSEPLRKIGDTVDILASSGTASHTIAKYIITGDEEVTYNAKKEASYDDSVITVLVTPTNFYGTTEYTNIICNTLETRSSVQSVLNDTGICMRSTGRSMVIGYYYATVGIDGTETQVEMREKITEYLKQQYAAGTPVTVWYVLATATTESFTAPTLPTTGTAETFDVDTTLKPSEVSLTWHGWHEHSDEKYVGGVVNKFNKDATDIDNTGYIKRDGTKQSSANFSTSGYIDVSGITTITLSGYDGGSEPACCLYNANKEYLSGVTYYGATTITVDVSQAAYIRFSFRNTAINTTMCNEGSTALPYHPYYEWVEE